MSLIETIRTDLKTAMKARDAVAMTTLRSIIAAVQEAEVSGAEATTLDDAGVEKVMKAQAKRRVEAAEAFDVGDRPEKAAEERAQLEVIERYLPEQLDEAAVAALVDQAIADGGFSTMKEMGQAMKAANALVAGRADGRIVAELVKSRLG
ncbi:MAG: hypothetical protein ACI91O_000951 [Candidatus Poriferisodalaceae bacterium]|jgi:uncharacterized protein YqeY